MASSEYVRADETASVVEKESFVALRTDTLVEKQSDDTLFGATEIWNKLTVRFLCTSKKLTGGGRTPRGWNDRGGRSGLWLSEGRRGRWDPGWIVSTRGTERAGRFGALEGVEVETARDVASFLFFADRSTKIPGSLEDFSEMKIVYRK